MTYSTRLVAFSPASVRFLPLPVDHNRQERRQSTSRSSILIAASKRAYERLQMCEGTMGPPSGIEKPLIGIGAKSVLDVARRQLGRRGASDLSEADLGSLDKELREALDVLRQSGNNPAGALWSRVKAYLSDRPAIFEDAEAKEWLARDDVQTLLCRATIALAAGQDIEPFEAEATRLYGVTDEGAGWYGAPLFEYAVAFMALSLRTRISVDARVQIATANMREAVRQQDFETLRAGQEKLIELVEDMTGPGGFPLDVIDPFLESEINRREALRSIIVPNARADALALAERVRSGDLARASASMRAKTFRFAAATCARNGDADAADAWLADAIDAGASDLEPDQARIAFARLDFDKAISLLGKRDDQMSNSLRLDAIHQRDGAKAAIEYFDRFCSPDKVNGFLLAALAHWLAALDDLAAAERLLASASATQLAENRALRFVRMRFRLALCAPQGEQAGLIATQTSLPQPSSLRDDPEGVRLKALALADAQGALEDLRSAAPRGFIEMLEVAEQFLALGSADPAVVAKARETVKSRLADPNVWAVYVPLTRPFGIEFDRAIIASQLDQAARLGGWDDTQLQAALNLAVQSDDPNQIVHFIDQHRERLLETIGPRQLYALEIEALTRSGRVADARAQLLSVASDIPDDDVQFLTDLMAEIAGEATPDTHLERYRTSHAEQDLILAMQAMSAVKDPRLPDTAQLLWNERHRIEDARAMADGLAYFDRDDELRDFLDEIGDTVSIDLNLQVHRAWIRYREGKLAEAEALVSELRPLQPDHASLRQLQINIAIEGGEWHNLGPLLAEDLDRKAQRSPQQLLQGAALATISANPVGRLLLAAAVEKGGNDAGLYASAYELAVRRGEDIEKDAAEWLNTALSLSDESGPIRKKTIPELIAFRDESAQRVRDIDRMILSGEVPLEIAARQMGMTLSSIFLEQAADGANRPDARSRNYLPLYAGNRGQATIGNAKRIAIEPVAIMVLHLLGLLETVIAAFDTIILPAGTLPLLMEDLIKSDRGQPSRAHRASQVRELIDRRKIVVEAPTILTEDIVADLFAIAEVQDGRLVHVPPLHVPGSLGLDMRDPAPFVTRLASLSAIVNALELRGEIDATEVAFAMRFPAIRQSWEEEAPVDLSRPLVLDSVSLNYLIDAKLIDPLIRTGAALSIASETVERANAEIFGQAACEALKGQIETVRAVLAKAIRSGKAIISPTLRTARARASDNDDTEFEHDPLTAILTDSAEADWLVADDRFVNQHGYFTDASGKDRGIATTLDLLRHLRDSCVIDQVRYSNSIQRLRNYGFGFIPVAGDEISDLAAVNDWSQGPGRPLRAVRDSVLLPLLRQSLQLPGERNWAERTLLALANSVKDCFSTLSADDASRAADFLFTMLPDLRALVASSDNPESELWAKTITVGVYAILAAPLGLDGAALEAYQQWFEGAPLDRLEGRDDDVNAEVVSRLKLAILTRYKRLEVPADAEPVPASAVARWMLLHVPQPLQTALAKDADIHDAVGLYPSIAIGSIKVEQRALHQFIADMVAGRASKLIDKNGTMIADSAELAADGTLTFVHEKFQFRFEQAALFSNDRALRERSLAEWLAANTLAPSREIFWKDKVADAPLDQKLFQMLAEEGRHTAETFVADMAEKMSEEDFVVRQLAQLPERHFLSLAETAAQDLPLDEMISELAARRQAGASPRSAAIAAAPLAIAPAFSIEAFAGPTSPGDALNLITALIEEGDPFSLLAAFELACRHVDDAACRAAGDRLMEDLWGADGAAEDLAHDYCAAAIITSVVTRWHGPMKSWSPAGRRLCVLAHAGLICRIFRQFTVERPGLLNQVNSWFGGQSRIDGMIDRQSDRGWSSALLVPLAIEAYLLRRFDTVLDTVEAAAQPPLWREIIKKRADRFMESLSPFLILPGPLDGLSDCGYKRTKLSSTDLEVLTANLKELPASSAADLLLRTVLIFDRPEEDISELIELIDARMRADETDPEGSLYQSVLQLVQSWGVQELAGAVASQNATIELDAFGDVQEALALAAANPDTMSRDNELLSLLLAKVRPPATNDIARDYSRAMELLINAEPRIRDLLQRVHFSASLGI